MKNSLKVIYCAGALLLVACFTHGQVNSLTNVEAATYARQRMLEVRQQMLDTPLRASDFAGMKVEKFQQQKLGKVKELP
jgi:PBP1b-binding outer membrane lipoprotein LpoB